MTEKRTYEASRPRKTKVTGEMFASGKKDALIRRRTEDIIRDESPITEELLIKRLINSFDLWRTGNRIGEHLEELLSGLVADGTVRRRLECGVPVYFTEPETTFFRTHAGKAADERYSWQTPPSEAAACLRYIRENGGEDLQEDELLERFKKEFGWKKAGSRVTALFENALSLIR